MERRFLNSENDWAGWKLNIGPYSGIDFSQKPASYPCVVLWCTFDQRNSSHDRGEHGYVYPEDFPKE
jgi:hypothetical protein